MSSEDSKFALDSTTIRALLVAIVPILTLLFNIEFSEEQLDQMAVVILLLVNLAASFYAAYGRDKADKPLRWKK